MADTKRQRRYNLENVAVSVWKEGTENATVPVEKASAGTFCFRAYSVQKGEAIFRVRDDSRILHEKDVLLVTDGMEHTVQDAGGGYFAALVSASQEIR